MALVVGVGITVVAALSPARKAAKVSPIQAMHEGVTASTGYGSKQRIYVGTGVLALGAAAVLVGLLAHLHSPTPVVGLGALLVFFGVAILGRTVALPLSRLLSAPLPRVRAIAGIIAGQK